MTTLKDVIAFAESHESTWDRDVTGRFGAHINEAPPWNRLYGPLHARGPNSGLILQHGHELAAWGEPDRADLTYSVVKTYLALLAGVAHDRGLLPDVDEPIGARLRGIGYDHGRNALITWRHMLQQTSEWEGTLWDIPDQADHYHAAAFGPPPDMPKGSARPLQAPGTYWEYNDVRVNQFALTLLYLFRKPLPEVFGEAIMDPIGATRNWQWVGYDNSWVEIDGRKIQSVTGGSHWGGGMSISARDQAKIGQLLLEDGMAGDKRVLSAEWIREMRQPCDIAPYYGYLTWLNHDQLIFSAIPASSYLGIGAGSSFVWIEPERKLVVVIRWLEKAYANDLFKLILETVDTDR
ncbi:class C beta-lactamase-related serine hydrolase [Allopusillimonas soli]|uniref:Serine hydrolase n=1 Tax=Allopusillimonas soli TaxID=659016 RepID=A0A853F9G5_9BURK|nr:serine hydrolase domain-containing protein [Allopusillimonas soli]NYT35570.1 serine hydrolase [Allopusillimonas soli]TEA75973.1 class C beta-lactamase-related serine hydrolase [Allopusillimonas soli]